MKSLSESQIIEQLKQIDTPTISNVVATYPGHKLCLNLYDAWYGNWYTDSNMKCMFPDFGIRVGFAATVVYTLKHPKQPPTDKWVLIDHIEDTKRPIALVAQQIFPLEIANRVSLFGGMSSTKYSALNVVATITNGPIRDLDEIRETGVQHYATGLTPAHGDMVEVAVGVPVTVCGLSVSPGDMLHMDRHGIVKFPGAKMDQVLKNALKFLELEEDEKRYLNDPKFSVAKWKEYSKKIH